MKLLKQPASKATYTALIAMAMLGAANIQSAQAADPAGIIDAPAPANVAGFYVSGFIGAGFTDDADFAGTLLGNGTQQTIVTDFDTGVNFGAAVGIYLNSYGGAGYTPRIELELSHLQSDVDNLDFSGNGLNGNENNIDGDISRTLLMANAYVDFDTGSALTPFIGGGLGVAFTNFDVVYGGAQGGAPTISFSDSDTNFAAQAIVGASYELSDSMTAFVDGRYTQVFDAGSDRFSPAGFTGSFEDDLSNFSANVGLRFDF